MKTLRPPIVAALALCVGLLGSVPTHAETTAPPAQACDPTSSVSLFAEHVGKRKIGYGLAPGRARIPGPTLTMTEGECLAVTLVNDTDKRLSMHAHGVHYTTASDGTPLNRSCVAPGKSRTYVFAAHTPMTRTDGTVSPGSAGYWHYHDHCVGTPHGTGGLRRGLFGALIVRRPGDTLPSRDPFVVVMNNLTINLKRAPNTPTFFAREGERVEFVVIGHGDLFHTFHLHGHRWADNRTGEPQGLTEDVAVIDNKTLGPADSFGFQVIAGEGVGPGAWMYHCHVQGHSDAGMAGIFMVQSPDGQVSPEAARTLRKWKRTHAQDHH